MKNIQKIYIFWKSEKTHQKSMSFVIPELWLKSEVNRLRNKKVRADLAEGGGANGAVRPPLCMSVYRHFNLLCSAGTQYSFAFCWFAIN